VKEKELSFSVIYDIKKFEDTFFAKLRPKIPKILSERKQKSNMAEYVAIYGYIFQFQEINIIDIPNAYQISAQ